MVIDLSQFVDLLMEHAADAAADGMDEARAAEVKGDKALLDAVERVIEAVDAFDDALDAAARRVKDSS